MARHSMPPRIRRAIIPRAPSGISCGSSKCDATRTVRWKCGRRSPCLSRCSHFFALPWIDKKKHGISVLGSIGVLAALGAIGSLTYVSVARDAGDAKYRKAHADARGTPKSRSISR